MQPVLTLVARGASAPGLVGQAEPEQVVSSLSLDQQEESLQHRVAEDTGTTLEQQR